MPFLNLAERVRISVCSVLAAVPAVFVSRSMTVPPPADENVMFRGTQEAPGTPGPPELPRTLQPCAETRGSSWAA
ncbi:hypothetical protein SMD44_08449 [Streptomyces alboflavus]|uniref:Secreted protein n=1 Tax=Streptomyces alboflavus TaxID=67267 RepID=A0A1Z1WRM0_9ACTN|nr:hypothetical protein SMD44_08449 [Streptomyces alboflavus]